MRGRLALWQTHAAAVRGAFVLRAADIDSRRAASYDAAVIFVVTASVGRDVLRAERALLETRTAVTRTSLEGHVPFAEWNAVATGT